MAYIYTSILFIMQANRVSGMGRKDAGKSEGYIHAGIILVYISHRLFYLLQLDMISDLLGTPKPDDIRSACSGARAHMLKKPLKAPTLAALYTLSPQASPEAVHLLCQMLVFDPVMLISKSVFLILPPTDYNTY